MVCRRCGASRPVEDFRADRSKKTGRRPECRECSRTRALAVDHDHNTGAVRALLCGRCNRGVGYFRDDPELLLNAYYYLLLGRLLKCPVPSGLKTLG